MDKLGSFNIFGLEAAKLVVHIKAPCINLSGFLAPGEPMPISHLYLVHIIQYFIWASLGVTESVEATFSEGIELHLVSDHSS
jgi:hypothetical protein